MYLTRLELAPARPLLNAGDIPGRICRQVVIVGVLNDHLAAKTVLPVT